MKISYINLLGKDYPLCFSLSATEKLTEEFGSMEQMQSAIKDSSVKSICTILDVLLEAGQKYCKVAGIDCPPPLPCRAGDVIDLSDPEAVTAIFHAISAGNERTVEAVEKNAVATPKE
jgi:hypothetical protein